MSEGNFVLILVGVFCRISGSFDLLEKSEDYQSHLGTMNFCTKSHSSPFTKHANTSEGGKGYSGPFISE